VPTDSRNLRKDALQIWRAGVAAVDSRLLVRKALRVEGDRLFVGHESYDLKPIRRIVIVGAGKAGAGMAEGVEQALGPRLLAEKQLAGWLNVPADCVRQLTAIHLHAARQPGQNEPTPEGAEGAEQILRLVGESTADDLCLALISGGGSALLPAPVAGISLADKLAVTRHLSAAGADIRQLNTVRKQLSRIKGGGLRRACRAGRLITLIISDVLGDPLDIIASGPTVDDTSTPTEALAVLEQFQAQAGGIAPAVFDYLHSQTSRRVYTAGCPATNLVIGNNTTAVDASAREAARLGYAVETAPTNPREGFAEDVGRLLADKLLAMRRAAGSQCLVSGGEPVVKLAPAETRGLGGRNQQLVLAAAEKLANANVDRFAMISGGTDGEDGPTDAAGAMLDEQILVEAKSRGLDAGDYLRRNDAYHFFEPLGALVKTGPTHTNVCDVRVIVVDSPSRQNDAGRQG
jgi:glycerate 2-kinase